MIFILMWAVIWGGVCAIVAANRGRSGFGWFLLGALFSFVALIVLVLLPRIGSLSIDGIVIRDKKCPQCAEMVKGDAKVCRFCGHSFEAALARPAAN